MHPWSTGVEDASRVISAIADTTRQDAFSVAATSTEEEGPGLGTVLEEIGLSNALLPIPTATASGTSKASLALHRRNRSSMGTADSRRTTQVQQQSARYHLTSFVM